MPRPGVRVFLAGTVALEIDGARIDGPRFPGRQGRILFAYLVAEQGRAVPRDELADALWEDALPATWDKALTVLASKLRTLFASHGLDGGTALTYAYGCYQLELPEGAWVDVLAAEAAAHDAETALAANDHAAAKSAAALAESLTRQSFVPGEDGSWVEQKRRELAEVRGRAMRVLVDACVATGDGAEAVKWAEEAVALEPFRESGYRRLMEAHAAAGDRAEALRVYDQCRRLLADELGTYPSPETEAVYRELLAAPARASDQPPPSAPERGRRTAVLALTAVAALTGIAVAALATRTGGAAVRPDSLVEVEGDAGKIDRVVPVGANPGEVAAVGKWIFVTSRDYGTLYRVARTNGRVTISGRYSTGLGLARQGNDLWVPSVKDGVMRLVSARSLGQERAGEIPIPEETNVPGIGVLPSVAAGDGSIWIAELANREVSRWRARAGAAPRRVRTYPLGPQDWTIGAAYGAGAAWFALGEPADAILKIDDSDGTATRIPVGKWPTTPAVGFGSVWVPMFSDDTVWRLDPSTGLPRAIVRVGRGPYDVAVGRRSVWVSDHCDGTVERIDPSTDSVVQTVHTGFHPQWLAAADKSVWVGLAGTVQDDWPCGADHSQ